MIVMLYSAVGIIVALGYLPQIYNLIVSHTPCRDISLKAWCIWEYTSSISLLYSLYGQDVVDPKFVGVNAVNLLFITIIISITVYKRRKYEKKVAIIDNIPDVLPDNIDL